VFPLCKHPAWKNSRHLLSNSSGRGDSHLSPQHRGGDESPLHRNPTREHSNLARWWLPATQRHIGDMSRRCPSFLFVLFAQFESECPAHPFRTPFPNRVLGLGEAALSRHEYPFLFLGYKYPFLFLGYRLCRRHREASPLGDEAPMQGRGRAGVGLKPNQRPVVPLRFVRTNRIKKYLSPPCWTGWNGRSRCPPTSSRRAGIR